MTPPALARMSGTTRMPLSARTASPSTVVGPLAPSTTTEAVRAAAWAGPMAPARAAGTNASQGTENSSSDGRGSPSG